MIGGVYAALSYACSLFCFWARFRNSRQQGKKDDANNYKYYDNGHQNSGLFPPENVWANCRWWCRCCRKSHFVFAFSAIRENESSVSVSDEVLVVVHRIFAEERNIRRSVTCFSASVICSAVIRHSNWLLAKITPLLREMRRFCNFKMAAFIGRWFYVASQ